jgi:hypothetical protein
MTGIKAIPADALVLFAALAVVTPGLDTERMVGLATDLDLALELYNAGEDLDEAEHLMMELQSAKAEEVYQMAVKASDLAFDRCGSFDGATTLEEDVLNSWKSCLQYVESTLKVRLSA